MKTSDRIKQLKANKKESEKTMNLWTDIIPLFEKRTESKIDIWSFKSILSDYHEDNDFEQFKKVSLEFYKSLIDRSPSLCMLCVHADIIRKVKQVWGEDKRGNSELQKINSAVCFCAARNDREINDPITHCDKYQLFKISITPPDRD